MAAFDIPFEPQLRVPGNRMCGAAALAMALRSLGIDGDQHDIWGEISRPDRRGCRVARTQLLAAAAIRRGVPALIVQASKPWTVLRRAIEYDVRVILNHRLRNDSPLGHYTVLVDIGRDRVILQDPKLGPEQQVARADLATLWRGTREDSEIIGHVLVALGRPTDGVDCRRCGRPMPPGFTCPRCLRTSVLEPAQILGCVGPACPARLWKRLFCPACDYGQSSVGVLLPPSG